MSGTTISALPAAASALSTDLVPVVEVGTPNVTKRVTVAQIGAAYLPLAGGTMTGTAQFDAGGVLLANNVPVRAKDAGGTTRLLLELANDDGVYVFNAGAGRTRFVNQAASIELVGWDNAGNVQINTSLTVAGAAAVINNGGTYAINISGTAAYATNAGFATYATNAGTVPWTGVSGRPAYAFNQSTDIGANVNFNYVEVGGGGVNSAGGGSFSGDLHTYGVAHLHGGQLASGLGAYINVTGVAAGGSPWNVNAGLFVDNYAVSPGWMTNSDGRTKRDVAPITPNDGVDWVLRGKPCTFTYDGEPRAGFVAQQEIEAGRGASVASVVSDDQRFAESDGFAQAGHRLVKNYEHDIPYLTAALQWALARIAALEARLG